MSPYDLWHEIMNSDTFAMALAQNPVLPTRGILRTSNFVLHGFPARFEQESTHADMFIDPENEFTRWDRFVFETSAGEAIIQRRRDFQHGDVKISYEFGDCHAALVELRLLMD